MKVAIIGSGPTGLSAAYTLSKHGVHVDIYERDKAVGGLAKSINLWQEQVELGPHFLKENLEESVKDLFQDILNDDDLLRYNRLTRINLDDMFLSYPPSAKNFLLKMGAGKTMLSGLSFLQSKVLPVKNNYSAETYMQRQLGNYLYINFFKEYTEKLWGIDCSRIDENYAISMIGFGNLGIKKLFEKFFTKSNIQLYGKCIYPKGGMSALWEKIKAKTEEQGGRFILSADIQSITREGNRLTGIQLADGNCNNYDCIISTITETAILKVIPGSDETIIYQLNSIKFRSVIAVFLKVDHCDFLKDNCVYLYSKQICATRITNYNRFRNKPGNDILMIEYWVDMDTSFWNYSDDEILGVVKKDIAKLPDGENVQICEAKIIRLKNAYPIPLMNLKNIKRNAASYLKTFEGLMIAGRSNQNNFNFGMEEALAEGIAKAQEILKIKQVLKEPV